MFISTLITKQEVGTDMSWVFNLEIRYTKMFINKLTYVIYSVKSL